MNVTIEYTGKIKELLDESKDVVDIEDGTGILDLIVQVANGKNEAFKSYLFGENMQFKSHVLLVLNDDMVSKGENIPLKSGDKILLMHAISGG